MSEDFPFELASYTRRTDPATSDAAADSVRNRLRWGSQRQRLLAVFCDHPDLTDEEAGRATGLYAARSCYWKRCGELRDLGLIADTGATRPSSCGHEIIVSQITPKGVNVMAELLGERAEVLA